MEKVIACGAEATLVKTTQDGRAVVAKRRLPKAYRHSELDARLRSARTRREANLLRKASSIGVPTPSVLSVDREACVITEEFLDGPVLGKDSPLSMYQRAGALAGMLHASGIVHGDLTPRNYIIHNNALHLLDFGLGFTSKRIEDYAVDLGNLKKSLFATHKAPEKAWEAVKKGYLKHAKQGKEALDKLLEVEKRARYS